MHSLPPLHPCPTRSLKVTLFRVHKHFISPEAHWYRSLYKLGESAGEWWAWVSPAL